MNTAIKIALASSLVAMVSPAMAQDVTGTVNISGTVASKCLVQPAAGNAFTATVALGELSQADGRLATDLATRFQSVGGTGLAAHVVCTTAAPTISVDATEIASAAPSATGYANRIDFTANVAVTTVTGSASFSNRSTASALAATAIGGRFANAGGSNIAITASNFSTQAATDLLVAASDYTGKIVVVIAPGA